MEKQIICYIQAYDCEKTIEAAMESVLKQTYSNWLCFVLSNGNKNTAQRQNATLAVIRNFASRDSRFIVINKCDNDLGIIYAVLAHLARCFPQSYICNLDGDDEFEPDFFARGIALAEAHDLDIVSCGTQIIRKRRAGDQNGVLIGQRRLDEDLVVDKEHFTALFPVYKTFFNETWGKLYRAELLRRTPDMKALHKKHCPFFVPDTRIVIDLLNRCSRIGVLSGTCHKFFQYEQRPADNATSLVNTYAANRSRTVRNRRHCPYDSYDFFMAFLRAHGPVSKEVYEYMQAVLFGWLVDIYNRTLLLVSNEKNFAELIELLLLHPKFDELMAYQSGETYQNLKGYDRRIEFCRLLQNTIIGQEIVSNRRIWLKRRLPCSQNTRKRLEQAKNKLENTVAICQAKREGKTC